jgi:5'-3' exonuclease
MGIERFYSTIINSSVSSGKAVVKNLKENVDVDYMYVDFNSIIYYIAENIEKDINTLLYHTIKNLITATDIEIITRYGINYDIRENNISKIIKSIKEIDTTDITLTAVEDFIDMLSTSVANPKLLKLLYIAIDGMPNMGKIWEQKRRRYSSSVMSKLQKIIYDDFKSKLDSDRITFESNKFTFDRSLIGPNSVLMDKIVSRLTSPEFVERLRGVLPSLYSIVVNHHNIPGEGEKKIMEHIIENKEKGTYCIYSPDSDVVVLSIILQNILSKHEKSRGSSFCVVRRDQQKNHYDYVDSTKVVNNIVDFISTMVSRDKIKNNMVDLINDICFVITLFGNDFVPRIQTINISVHIDLILEKYGATLNKLNKKFPVCKRYLIDNSKNYYTLNWVFFMELIDELASSEHLLYSDMYIENHYNYRWLKRYMSETTITHTLYKYIELINNKVFPAIFEYNNTTDTLKKEDILNNIMQSVLSYFGVKNISSMITLLNSHNIDALDPQLINSDNKTDIENTYRADIFVRFFVSSHNFDSFKPKRCDIKENNKIKVMLKFVLDNFDFNKRHRLLKGKFQKSDIDDDYNVKIIEESMPVQGMDVTAYDKEIYKLDRRIEPYKIMLNENPENNTLGYLNIKYIKRKNIPKYEIDQQSAKINYAQYLTEYINIPISDNVEIMKIAEQYVVGLCWVLDFYINKNNREENLKYVSVWFYPNYYAPTLYMISMYLHNMFASLTSRHKDIKKKLGVFNNILNTQVKNMMSVSNKELYVTRENFINKQEHYLYVNPVNDRDNMKVDDIYMPLREDRTIFPDIRHLAQEMYDNREKFLGHMDCKTALYNSKCRMDEKLMPSTNFHSYMEKIKLSVGDKRKVPTLDDMNDSIAYI